MNTNGKTGLDEILGILRSRTPELKQKYQIRGIWVFGSYVKGEQTERSDLDLLVEFEPGYKTFKNYMRLKYALEEILGMKVDLILRNSLRKEIRETVFKEAVNV